MRSRERREPDPGDTATGLAPLDATDAPVGLESDAGEDRLRLVLPEIWCRHCDTMHEERRCPGTVRVSGPERHGWRIVTQTRAGRRVHGALIAPAEGRWRARILTYPRVLWLYPGRETTIKFIANGPHQAERMAREFIEWHCRRQGHTLLYDEEPAAVVGAIDQDHNGPRRKPRAEHVDFCEEGDTVFRQARTSDLSDDGLFLVTDVVYCRGTRIRMKVEIGPYVIPLTGEVRWVRHQASPGRPRGLGLQIDKAPAPYLDFVAKLP